MAIGICTKMSISYRITNSINTNHYINMLTFKLKAAGLLNLRNRVGGNDF